MPAPPICRPLRGPSAQCDIPAPNARAQRPVRHVGAQRKVFAGKTGHSGEFSCENLAVDERLSHSLENVSVEKPATGRPARRAQKRPPSASPAGVSSTCQSAGAAVPTGVPVGCGSSCTAAVGPCTGAGAVFGVPLAPGRRWQTGRAFRKSMRGRKGFGLRGDFLPRAHAFAARFRRGASGTA